MNILFRADSSSTIGTGHIMRDLVLAKQYPNSKITFATQELEGNLNSKIKESGYEVKVLNSNRLDELIEVIAELKIDMIVIDHYGIDYEFEKELKERIDIKIMVLDDTYENHFSDILLNHNISADESRYKGLVPTHCELRCGSKYTLLREEFYEVKKQKKVFLAMGGADHSHINIKILEVLKNFSFIEVNLVTTSANQNLDELKEYVKDKSWIKLFVNSNEIAKLMKESDFAIVTPSVTVNEVHFMGVPFLAIMTADNQIEVYKYLNEKKYFVMNKFHANKLDSFLKKTL